ncbi:hypothetical protein [Streptomyces sp. NPDC057740]|uniref:hypothetical protein n=1 Tax=Streptomyces sp. NPDC057740 TaxID=3346234 RepID=UPI0036A3CAA2
MATEAGVGHHAGAAAAGAGVQEAVAGLDVAEVVGEYLRLGCFQAVHPLDDALLAGVGRACQDGGVVLAEAVVVVVEAVDLTELAMSTGSFSAFQEAATAFW